MIAIKIFGHETNLTKRYDIMYSYVCRDIKI